MKTALFSLLMVLPSLVHAQDRSWEAKLEQSFKAGGKVTLDLSAGGYRILPCGEEGRIRVRWSTKRADQMSDARVQVTVEGGEAHLRARGPKEDFRVEIEVPRRSDLQARLSVGELSVKGIEGHKELRCRIGEIQVEVPDAQAYGHVDASVKIGELSARPFGASKEGFFRSFCWDGKGSYRLEAKVGIGEVKFE